MEHPSPTLLPWEWKAASVGLFILALQELHVGVLRWMSVRVPFHESFEPAWITPLTCGFFLLAAVGLLRRQGPAFLAVVSALPWAAMEHLRHGREYLVHTMNPVCSHCQKPDWYGSLWLATQMAWLIAVPAVLILGKLREGIRKRALRP